jgi:hypothetical protein
MKSAILCKAKSLVAITLSFIYVSSCSESNFGGGDGSNRFAAKPISKAKDDPTPFQPNSNPQSGDLFTPQNYGALCSKSNTAQTINLSIPTHRDSARDGSAPRADVLESVVAEFDSVNFEGDVLQVSQFTLDDVVIMVKKEDSFPQIGRQINLPPHAIMIYNANDANFSAGSLDSTTDTTYSIPGRPPVFIPRGKRTLREVYALGAPLIPHNKIALSELAKLGYWDQNRKVVSFKLIHVAHGLGYVGMVVNIPSCK